MAKRKQTEFPAVLTYKTKDEVASRIMNEKYVNLVLDVYMTPAQFAELITQLTGTSFTISIKP